MMFRLRKMNCPGFNYALESSTLSGPLTIPCGCAIH